MHGIIKMHRRSIRRSKPLDFPFWQSRNARADTLSVCIYPNGVDDAKFRAAMFEEGVVVAGALGAYAGKAFRLGHMGNIDQNTIVQALSAVERSLKACGCDIRYGTAVGAYMEAINE